MRDSQHQRHISSSHNSSARICQTSAAYIWALEEKRIQKTGKTGKSISPSENVKILVPKKIYVIHIHKNSWEMHINMCIKYMQRLKLLYMYKSCQNAKRKWNQMIRTDCFCRPFFYLRAQTHLFVAFGFQKFQKKVFHQKRDVLKKRVKTVFSLKVEKLCESLNWIEIHP